jgi:hypothetical protein
VLQVIKTGSSDGTDGMFENGHVGDEPVPVRTDYYVATSCLPDLGRRGPWRYHPI